MRISHLNNIHVSVEVPQPWYSRNDDDRLRRLRSDATDIAAAIRRHVDGIGAVFVTEEHERLCQHCLGKWTEDSAEYNGGCCDKDVDEEDARAAAKAAIP